MRECAWACARALVPAPAPTDFTRCERYQPETDLQPISDVIIDVIIDVISDVINDVISGVISDVISDVS